MALFNSFHYFQTDPEKLQFVEEATKNADSVQGQVLAEILSRNAETEYLKRYKLNGATDRDSFKAKIPVVGYEDLRPDIERIANGDRSAILSSSPIIEFNASSGTTEGKRKLLPLIREDYVRRIFFFGLISSIINGYIPGLHKGKGVDFITLRSDTKTAGGIIARTALTTCFKSLIQSDLWLGTKTADAVLCQDNFQSMYVQMLSALYHRFEILHIGSTFASGLVRCFDFLQQNWPQLSFDISTGTLTDKIIEKSVRDAVIDILKPDPGLADFIRDQCSRRDWYGIVSEIWPNTKCFNTVVTGSMSQYISKLQFYGPGIPILSMGYASSECFSGINLKPLSDPYDISYTLLPNMAYFEFIPQDTNERMGSSELIDLVNVKIGKEYELVITTHAGLYRYQVGDILRAVAFHNTAPQFKFVRRKNVLLSIDSDKTNEVELQKAVENASELIKPFGTSVAEYTSYADTTTIPGHYVVFWELIIENPENAAVNEVMERCCLEIEEALNTVYRQCRVADGIIGPLEIRVVKRGTFEELMELAVSQGSSIAQYKVPKCVKDGPLFELLNSRVVSAHFSPALPKWSIDQSI